MCKSLLNKLKNEEILEYNLLVSKKFQIIDAKLSVLLIQCNAIYLSNLSWVNNSHCERFKAASIYYDIS